jgi:hypothetical protein
LVAPGEQETGSEKNRSKVSHKIQGRNFIDGIRGRRHYFVVLDSVEAVPGVAEGIVTSPRR